MIYGQEINDNGGQDGIGNWVSVGAITGSDSSQSNTMGADGAKESKTKRLMEEFVSSLASVEHYLPIIEVGAEDDADCVKSEEQSSLNVEIVMGVVDGGVTLCSVEEIKSEL